MRSLRRRAGFALALTGTVLPAGLETAHADPAPAMVNWSGFYIGGNLGAAFGETDLKAGVVPGAIYFSGTDNEQIADAGSGTARQGSFAGGVVAGYNAQAGHILFGLEAGANAFGFDDSHSGTANFFT